MEFEEALQAVSPEVADWHQAAVVTTAQAAELLDCSVRTVLRYVHEDKLTYYRTPGGYLRIYRSSLDKWLPTVD